MTAATDTVWGYHTRTKHRLDRYAAGPETLDWDAQPDPFRRFTGAPLIPLPLLADGLATPWSAVCDGTAVAQPVSLSTLGLFFELSFALTAWKQHGPDRWALRANPSSGNLHPTEAYLLAGGVEGLADGLYHYAPREHALELRVPLAWPASSAPSLWIGLSSIQWREAWKYGERAFRYCQLDTGHAIGAARYAAAALGWRTRLAPGSTHAQIATLLGLDRDDDFGPAEREEPECLLQIGPPASSAALDAPSAKPVGTWCGRANRLDARPMYRWPVIDEVARATRRDASPAVASSPDVAVASPDADAGRALLADQPAATLIRQRRSAQHFDRRRSMPQAAWLRILASLMPAAHVPWDAWPLPTSVQVICWAHRVDGVEPGAYLLARDAAALPQLQAALHTGQDWVPPDGSLPLWRIARHPALAGTLRTLSCHQAIASDACIAFSLLAPMDGVATDAPRYRELLQEAGLIGQVLYLQAEAEGLRGTGIGCYFDDAVHELLGLAGDGLQVLYHFTIGHPMADARITTEPPYAHRPATGDPA